MKNKTIETLFWLREYFPTVLFREILHKFVRTLKGGPMSSHFKTVIFILSTLCFMPATIHSQIYKDPKADVESRVRDLLDRMTLDEKIDLLSGDSVTGFDTRENTRLGIPAFRMTDGPIGVRWGKTTAFPGGVSMAATWDVDLIVKFAGALAVETHARGRNYLLGPCVNIHRFPAGGRNFESYGEDPYLASRLAVSYIRTLQSNDVIPSVKHYALNNQEWKRTEIDVIADERAMREIYLPAFEASVKEAGVYTVMSAYNKVNGWWCSENDNLLNEILKKEWGFKGVVISDWGSTHSTEYAVNHGLDLEMPSAFVYTPAKLKKAIAEGKISEETINDKVSRNLRIRFLAGLFDRTFNSDTSVFTGDAHKKLALELAKESIVLLKNEKNILPLDPGRLKRIAVIGPNAAVARTGGGGSSRVTPVYSVSPLAGIKNLVGGNVEVVYEQGVVSRTFPVPPVKTQFLFTPGKAGNGLKAEFFNNMKLEGAPVFTRTDPEIDFNWEDDPPAPGVGKDNYSVRWTGLLVPEKTRTYTFVVASDDGVRLFIDGKKMIDNWTDHGTTVDTAVIDLKAGKSYEIKLEFYENGGSAVITLSWDFGQADENSNLIARAAEAARKSDVAIVFAGTSDNFESEGFDRIGGLSLPEGQDELIKSVAAANPATIVVLNTGTPVITEAWLKKIPALIEAFFPGQEGGNAIAAILFGEHNPSAKLPFSFISGYDQTPAYKGYMDKSLEAPYSEGIFTGYRYLGRNKLTPTFPFGFGLSYTSFAYSDMKVKQTGTESFEVSLWVKNTGKVSGSEIVQLYVADDHSRLPRPPMELKGFVKVKLEPGDQKTVTMTLNSRSFAYYDPAAKQWTVDKGNFELLAGSSSADIRLRSKIRVD